MTDTAPRPISDHENSSVLGLAQLGEEILDETLKAANDLRERDRAYEATLPSSPIEAFGRILDLLHHDHSDYPEGLDRAFHLASVVESALRDPVLNEDDSLRSIMLVVEQIVDELRRTRSALDEIARIAQKSRREAKRPQAPAK